MKEIIEYKTLSLIRDGLLISQLYPEFDEMVNNHIKDGWQPYGDRVTLEQAPARVSGIKTIAQTMVKYKQAGAKPLKPVQQSTNNLQKRFNYDT